MSLPRLCSALLAASLLAACQTQIAPIAPQTLQAQSQSEVLVRLAPEVNPMDYARAHGLRLLYKVGLGIYAFQGQSSVQALTQDRRALWVEPERKIQLPPMQGREALVPSTPVQRTDAPNDPLLPAQYGYSITGMETVWKNHPGREEVVVAVIDSGIDVSHPDLQGQVLPGWDFTLKEPAPGGQVDGYGHGTHVAGVIGAKTNNGIGIAGIAPGAKLLPVRIFNNWGSSTAGRSAAAVIWAVDHGAKVINASWGSPMEGKASKEAYQYAIANDVVFVAAVGNSGKDDTMYYPGASEEAIGVAATRPDDRWASFSTFGDWVDLAAPGGNILSTYPLKKGNGYRIMDGTSMAAPFVSGAAALLRSAHPDWTAAQVREALEATAKDVIMKGKDKYSGFGRIDIPKALVYQPVR